MEKAPADYIHSSGDTPPPRLSARSLHAVCTLSAQICTNLHEIYTNLHLSELDKAGCPFPAPPGPKAAMRTGLVGSVGRLCGSALCGGHRGDGAALAGRRGRVVCRLLCRKMGGGARGARIRCSEGGRRCWRCGGMAWGRWRVRTTEYTSGDVRANLGGHPAPRPPGDRHCH